MGPALSPQIPQGIWMMALMVALVSLELWSACREAGSTLTLQSEIRKKKNRGKTLSLSSNISKINSSKIYSCPQTQMGCLGRGAGG